MQYEFSSLWPNQNNQPQVGSPLYLIDESIKKYNKEIDDFHNGKSYLSNSELKRIEKKVTDLHAQKQTEEIKTLINMELIAYQGKLALLAPTFPA